MDEQTKDNLEKGAEHLLHAVEDAADVVGHTAAGAVKGAADGVEGASAATKAREVESES
jgi:hypothetical protein